MSSAPRGCVLRPAGWGTPTRKECEAGESSCDAHLFLDVLRLHHLILGLAMALGGSTGSVSSEFNRSTVVVDCPSSLLLLPGVRVGAPGGSVVRRRVLRRPCGG